MWFAFGSLGRSCTTAVFAVGVEFGDFFDEVRRIVGGFELGRPDHFVEMRWFEARGRCLDKI